MSQPEHTESERPDGDECTSSGTRDVAQEQQEKPYSAFSKYQRWGIVGLVSLAGFFSPTTGQVFFPAIPEISRDLNTSAEMINLTVTYYMIGQAVTPTLGGALSDTLGRRPVYVGLFVIYVGASVGLVFTSTYAALVVLRILQVLGSASVIAVGGGTISDIAPRAQRGGYLAMFQMGAMVGPCIGPVAGGLLSGAFGWHSIFIFLAIAGGVVLVAMLLLLPETLRAIVGDGSVPTKGVHRPLVSYCRRRRAPVANVERPPKLTWRDIDLLAPIKSFWEVDRLLLFFYVAIISAVFYALLASTSTTYERTYGLSLEEIGACYAANGGGAIIGGVFNSKRANWDYEVVRRAEERKKAERAEKGEKEDGERDFPIEHARLRSVPIPAVGLILITVAYGWMVEEVVSLAGPLVFQFMFGFFIVLLTNALMTLLLDGAAGESASIMAASNLSRCLVGAGGTAIIEPMIQAIGVGWSFTVLGLVLFACSPMLYAVRCFGARFRLAREARRSA